MRRVLIALALLAIGSPVLPQDKFMDNFVRGYQLGQAQRQQQSEEARRQAEAEYFRQQAALVRQQRELLEKEAKELAAQKATAQRVQGVEAEAAEWTRRLLQIFEYKHPDYRKYEADMVRFGALLKPADQMNPMDYLEALCLLAKSDIPR